MKPILLALQFSPHDLPQALKLLDLLREKTSMRDADGYELALCPRFDVVLPEGTMEYMQRAFRVHVWRGAKRDIGWPVGCNALWVDTMLSAFLKTRDAGLSGYENPWSGVFTFEPDCVPTHRNWLPILREKWKEALDAGKLCMGHVQPRSLTKEHFPLSEAVDFTHMNGNALFVPDWFAHFPQMQHTTVDSWDCHWAHLIIPVAQDYGGIVSRYRATKMTEENLLEERIPGEPVIFVHGVKDDSALEIARRIL